MKREMIWGLILQDVIPVPGNLRQAKPWMAYVMWSETRTCARMLSKKNYRVLMNIYVDTNCAKSRTWMVFKWVATVEGQCQTAMGYYQFISDLVQKLHHFFIGCFDDIEYWSLPNSCPEWVEDLFLWQLREPLGTETCLGLCCFDKRLSQ